MQSFPTLLESRVHMSIFTASVQYDDFKGTAAADQSDNVRLVDYLRKHDLAKENEHVVGFRLAFGGNHGHEINPGVVVYLRDGSFDDPSERIRAVEISMETSKLFSFFKRFDLVLTQKGVLLDETKVEGPFSIE